MRKSFSKFQQTEILGNQDYKCRSCKTRFSKNIHPQYDHISGDRSDNRTENGQAICSNCHDAKSRKENVKRSIKQKDTDFVKYCPLCEEELKGKHYKDDDGNKITTKHLAADDFIPCRRCESVFKVVRQDHKAGNRKLSGKKLKGVIKHCTHCGVTFNDDADDLATNTFFRCAKCKKIWGVWIKTYKKR